MASPLTLLGQTLQQASANYAEQKQKDEDEARHRAERLADVQSSRTYEQGNITQARSFQLSDEERHRFNALPDEQKKLVLENRFKALQEAESRGLIRAADFDNQVVADAALVSLGEQLAKEAKFQVDQRSNATGSISALQQQEQAVRQKMDTLEAKLSSRPSLDQRAVQARALEIATQNAKGKTPSREQIAMAMADATKEATDAATMQWYQDKQDAQVQYQILSNQLNTLRQQQASLSSTFHVAPSPLTMASPAASPTATAPAQGGNPMAGFVAQLGGAATPSPAPAVSAGPTPMVRGQPQEPAFDPSRFAMAGPASMYSPAFDSALTSVADRMRGGDTAESLLDSGARNPSYVPARIDASQNRLQAVQDSVTPDPGAQNDAAVRLILQQLALRRQAPSPLTMSNPFESVPITRPTPGVVSQFPFGFR